MTPEADAPDAEETETAETPVAVAEDAAPVEDVPAEEPVPVSNKSAVRNRQESCVRVIGLASLGLNSCWI